MQLVGTKQHSVRMFSDGMDDFVMDEKTLKANPSSERHTECRNYNNVEKISQLLLQNQLPEDDRMIETCRSFLSVLM